LSERQRRKRRRKRRRERKRRGGLDEAEATNKLTPLIGWGKVLTLEQKISSSKRRTVCGGDERDGRSRNVEEKR